MRPGGQREKGKAFERLIASKLRTAGFTVRRGRQAEGAVEPDLVVSELPKLWIECGHGATMRGSAKLAQAEADVSEAGRPGSICAAVTRRNGEPIRVTMRLGEVIRLLAVSPPIAALLMVEIEVDDWIETVVLAGEVSE